MHNIVIINYDLKLKLILDQHSYSKRIIHIGHESGSMYITKSIEKAMLSPIESSHDTKGNWS